MGDGQFIVKIDKPSERESWAPSALGFLMRPMGGKGNVMKKVIFIVAILFLVQHATLMAGQLTVGQGGGYGYSVIQDEHLQNDHKHQQHLYIQDMKIFLEILNQA